MLTDQHLFQNTILASKWWQWIPCSPPVAFTPFASLSKSPTLSGCIPRALLLVFFRLRPHFGSSYRNVGQIVGTHTPTRLHSIPSWWSFLEFWLSRSNLIFWCILNIKKKHIFCFKQGLGSCPCCNWILMLRVSVETINFRNVNPHALLLRHIFLN